MNKVATRTDKNTYSATGHAQDACEILTAAGYAVAQMGVVEQGVAFMLIVKNPDSVAND